MNNFKEILEFYPIKLVGGFIVTDKKIGCLGCSFCLSNRNDFIKKLYSKNVHFIPEYITPQNIAKMLLNMKPITKAKIPLRLGHNTDCFYQWDYVNELYKLIPKENPVIALTRLPLPSEYKTLFQNQKNIILKLSLTPKSKLLNYNSDVDNILQSITDIPKENIFILIGPVAVDSFESTKEIINKIPSGYWIDIKKLTTAGILPSNYAATTEQIENLREIAIKKNLIVTDYFGCKIRVNMNRPFYKAFSSPQYIKDTCKNFCPNYILCYKEKNINDLNKFVIEEAKEIGLTLKRINEYETDKLQYFSEIPVSRGDETYLSELSNIEVLLNIKEGSQGGSFANEDIEIHKRWEKYNMLPTTELNKLSIKIYSDLLERMRE